LPKEVEEEAKTFQKVMEEESKKVLNGRIRETYIYQAEKRTETLKDFVDTDEKDEQGETVQKEKDFSFSRSLLTPLDDIETSSVGKEVFNSGWNFSKAVHNICGGLNAKMTKKNIEDGDEKMDMELTKAVGWGKYIRLSFQMLDAFESAGGLLGACKGMDKVGAFETQKSERSEWLDVMSALKLMDAVLRESAEETSADAFTTKKELRQKKQNKGKGNRELVSQLKNLHL
jgi:hypothetical protein